MRVCLLPVVFTLTTSSWAFVLLVATKEISSSFVTLPNPIFRHDHRKNNTPFQLHLFGNKKNNNNKNNRGGNNDKKLDSDTTNNDDVTVEKPPKQPHKKKTETLQFGGIVNYTSQELPLPKNIQTLHSFFSVRTNQEILLTGGAGNSGSASTGRSDDDDDGGGGGGGCVEEISLDILPPPTPPSDNAAATDILEKWKANAFSMGASEPNPKKDTLLRVVPLTIPLSVAEVCPETLLGTKLTSRDYPVYDDVSCGRTTVMPFPEFQAVLIEDYPRARGPKPLVWLFDRIIYGSGGGTPPVWVDSSSIVMSPPATNEDEDEEEKNSNNLNNNNSSSNRSRNEKALLRIWAEPTDTFENFVFTAEAKIRLEFAFPKLLLRFFPMDKDKAEEMCNNAIAKALQSNLKPAVEELTRLYIGQMKIMDGNVEDSVVDRVGQGEISST